MDRNPRLGPTKSSNGHLNVAGFWMFLKIYVFYSGRDPRDPPNRPGKADPDNHRELLIFEAGAGDRLATLRVSRAKR